jgi:hypothetical protein
VFLQFVDDLQDVLNDLRNYQMTIFSQLAGKYLLDSLANKLLNFIARICAIHLTRPTQEPLKKILISNCYFLVLRSIGKNRQLFSKHYVQQMENFFPVSFDYYDHTKKKLTKVFRKYKGSGTNIDTLIELFTYLISDNLAVAA